MVRHWFITGASGGLGRHLVVLALAEGDAVVATVRRPHTLSELSTTYGERLMVEQLDVTDREQVKRVIARCLARGRIDIVVNNAGGGLIGATEEMTDAQVQAQIALNLLAPIQITCAFLKPMREQGGGRIIQISAVEAAVHASGLTFTLLRPNLYMQGLLHFRQSIQAQSACSNSTIPATRPTSARWGKWRRSVG